MTPRRYTLIVLAVAALGLAAAWLFANRLGMAFLESGYPIVVAKRALVAQCQAGEVAILGDSRAEAAVIPAELPLPAANLALGATGPVESYFTARALLRCPQPPKLVIYAHSIEAFQTVGQGIWQRGARFGLLSFTDLRDIAATAATLHDTTLDQISTNDGLSGILRDLAYSTGFPSVFLPSALQARLFGRWQSNLRVRDAVSTARGHVVYPDDPSAGATGHDAPIGRDATIGRFAPIPLETHYTKATFALLSQAGVDTVVIPIPLARATLAALQPGVAAATVAFIADQTHGIPHVSDDFTAVIAWPDRYFVDGSHMNKAGATLFSRRLAACVTTWRSTPAAPCDLAWQDGD